VTVLVPTPVEVHAGASPARPKGSLLLALFRTTDHKQIGVMYLVATFAFFMVGEPWRC
jgi:cytochrome c oxidase subunit I